MKTMGRREELPVYVYNSYLGIKGNSQSLNSDRQDNVPI